MMPLGLAPAPSASVTAAGLILRRRTPRGDRWLLLRGSRNHEWGFPKGHQDPGESAATTAMRECAEECGIALVAIDGAPLEVNYLLASGRAKRVLYYPASTASERVALSDEHCDWAWLSAQQVVARLPHTNVKLMFRAYLHGLEGGR